MTDGSALVRAGRAAPARPPLEVWGGVESTVNRVGDVTFDQLTRSGHCDRLDDLDRFAELGIRALRFPMLWERIAPQGLAQADWRWADAAMERLRVLGVRPILGLVHHGSGPRHTSLLDDSFPGGLAAFAAAVARRYPWATDFCPVNEPLTTARFSGLYGLWYPHHRSLASFVRALLVQCRATVLAMRAIRSVTPSARLVQTEDFGHTFATRRLAYQAGYENERRFLSLDLLCGRVTSAHPLWNELRAAGATTEDLSTFLREPPPDVVGVDYYLTSDRLLDHRLARYPEPTHGGNGRERYADVEAVRAWRAGVPGHLALLRRLWRRYGLPLAITEVHAGATREEQLRWLSEAWSAATRARDAGIDVRAVTAWALLGSWDWDSHVTRARGSYEPGVFDVRDGRPRATALAHMVRDLAAGRVPAHPVLAVPGW
jgi:dTDP-4-dehydrorhamnose reductase